jgi:hypothetical protein
MKGTLWVVAVAAMMAAMSVSLFISRPAVAAFDNTSSMRMPFSPHEMWKVINGYNSGPCHYHGSTCGGDEYYAFDIAPVSGDAGGRYVYSPVAGYVYGQPFWMGSGRGYGVKIKTSDGYLIHLYHLMNVQVSSGQRVLGGSYVGQVYNAYSGAPNHLHIQQTNSSGTSIPLKLSGKTYYDRRTTNQWYGQPLQNNVLYYDANYSGTYTNYAASDSWLGDDAVGNDRVSSVRVNSDCTIWLYEHWYFGGRSYGFRSNTPNLVNYGFNDMASSMWLSC